MEPTAVMPAANHETQPMAQNGIAPSVPPSLSRAEMIEQLCAYDDAEFADTLLTLTEKNHYGHGFTMLHDPTVLARVLACTDEWFIYAVTAMAHETHIGVDLLFAEVIKRRVNALPPDTFRGKFSMSLRRVLPGFDMHAYQRSLWEQQQLDLRQQAPPTQMHQVTPPPPALLPRGVDIEQDRARLPQVVRQAEEVLLTLPGAPVIFQRARRLVSVAPA